MLVDTTTGLPMGEADFRRLHPNTSFPKDVAAVDLSALNAARLTLEPQPETAIYQTATRATTATQSGGRWVLGWTVSDIPVDEARHMAKRALIAWADEFLGQFTRPYPQTEVLTWPMQSEAARNFVAGEATAAQTSFLTGLGQGRGLTAPEMAAKIIEKADPYEAAIQATVGLRNATEAAIEAAQPAQMQGILDAAKESALAKARELNLI